MSKAAIIISGNYFKTPAVLFYAYYLDKINIDYDIISWNRLNIEEANIKQFNLGAGEDRGYFERLISYLKYRKFVIKQLNEVNYNKIIVITIPLGILLYTQLKKTFINNYIFDIRDYSAIVPLLNPYFKKIVHHSRFTVISSRGFLNWMPLHQKIFFTHNFPLLISRKVELYNVHSNFDPQAKVYTIITIGTLRDFVPNKVLIEALGNHPQYRLKFVGSGPAEKQLIEFTRRNRFKNIEFHGLYKKEDELKLINEGHFINILTGSDINSKTLTSNRLYLSVILGIPMIVYNDTFQGSLCLQYSLGCNIKRGGNVSDTLKNYISNFDKEKYDKNRGLFIQNAANEIHDLEKATENFLIH